MSPWLAMVVCRSTTDEEIMANFPVPAPRAHVSETANGWQITIPPRRNIGAMIFLPVWLCGWLFGEVMVIRELAFVPVPEAPSLFMIIWLAGWTLGGGLAIFALLWMYVGMERILLRPDALVIARELNGREVHARQYAIGNTSNLRVVPDDRWAWGFGGGKIAFDYGARTFRFGAGIDEAEARDIVSQMQKRQNFPSAN